MACAVIEDPFEKGEGSMCAEARPSGDCARENPSRILPARLRMSARLCQDESTQSQVLHIAFTHQFGYSSSMTKVTSDYNWIKVTKESGKVYSDTSKRCDYYPTPDSTPSKADGHLSDPAASKGPRLWRDVNPAAVPNTYTGKGGSKRGS
jgi:hypothetical protein